jgi:TM2 domain-containing membrane protein YozV
MASPLLALILSFFIPGLGQLYTGQFLKAILVWIVAGILAFFWFTIIAIPFLIIVWLYSMYDAYTAAQRT